MAVLLAAIGVAQTGGGAASAPELRGVDGLVRAYDCDPRSAVRGRRHGPEARLPAGAGRSLRRPGGHGPVVADPARSRQPGSRRRVFDGRRARHRCDRSLGGACSNRRRGVVLPGRRLRRPGAVARAPQRKDGGGARRQTHPDGARTRGRTRPDTGRCLLRDGDVQGPTRTSRRQPRSSCASC